MALMAATSPNAGDRVWSTRMVVATQAEVETRIAAIHRRRSMGASWCADVAPPEGASRVPLAATVQAFPASKHPSLLELPRSMRSPFRSLAVGCTVLLGLMSAGCESATQPSVNSSSQPVVVEFFNGT